MRAGVWMANGCDHSRSMAPVREQETNETTMHTDGCMGHGRNLSRSMALIREQGK